MKRDAQTYRLRVTTFYMLQKCYPLGMKKKRGRGRPTLPRTKKRSERVAIYLEPGLFRWAAREAKRGGLTMAGWIRQVLADRREDES